MPTVLIIEDDADARRVMRRLLISLGYDVGEAANGYDGVRMFKQGTFDAVLLDMFMPEKDGLETLRELRWLDAKVRVVAVSGGGTRDTSDILHAAILMGASKALLKPFTRAELEAALDEVLSDPA